MASFPELAQELTHSNTERSYITHFGVTPLVTEVLWTLITSVGWSTGLEKKHLLWTLPKMWVLPSVWSPLKPGINGCGVELWYFTLYKILYVLYSILH
jgi:hypothetical protein